MNSDEWLQNPLVILARLIGVAAIVVAIGYALQLIIPAIGTAVGLAGAILTGGISATGALAPWIVPVTAGGVGLAGGGVTMIVLRRIVVQAEREPFYWLSPVLSVFGGFVSNFGQELYPLPGIPSVVYGAISAAAFEGGGILFRRKGILVKFVGCVLWLFPPVLLVWNAARAHWSSDLTTTLLQIDPTIWWSLVLLILAIIGIGLLAYADRELH
jgi:hypothetical protein